MPDAAAQTRIVSVTGIRLNSMESVRSFKGIICDDISQFESYMPSHAVRSPPLFTGALSRSSIQLDEEQAISVAEVNRRRRHLLFGLETCATAEAPRGR